MKQPVETVEGYRDIHVPSGIQPGDTLMFASMGVPNINKPSVWGDHHFIVRVEIPKTISNEERSLVEKLVSLRDASIDHTFSSNGKLQENIDKHKMSKRHNRVLQKETKHSLWSTLKKLLGQNRRTGFASVSVQTSAPVLITHGKADPSLVICISGVLVVTCILSFISDRTVSGLFTSAQLYFVTKEV